MLLGFAIADFDDGCGCCRKVIKISLLGSPEGKTLKNF
jgi:hypothetical protein